MLGHLGYCGKRSTERVPAEVGVCTVVVLGILGSKTFPTINGKTFGNGWRKLILNFKVKKRVVKLKGEHGYRFVFDCEAVLSQAFKTCSKVSP